mmetsp:Transcript_11050/g.20060  ORF Transcript_11050/g.20060 Transcript_11050/m.20060 type:complete len:482 (+) Transcript_11050:55-1500(+)
MAPFDFDLFVIGGGSGGLASAKAAASLGKSVGVADFVKPSPYGTTWDLGGTCVNVGCIPKKLMHISSLYREAQADLHGLGWDTSARHDWESMTDKVNKHIKSLNWSSKTELRSQEVKYYHSYATFVDAHTVQLDNGAGKVEKVTAEHFLVACGGRPNMSGEGAEECCISSDDIFWMKSKPPGKTLVIGASYIALECAGFLAGFGFDVTVMVRSILLRGFDQDMATRIGEYMEKHGVKFARGLVPSKFEKLPSGQVKVYVDGNEYGVYDTVLQAIGRKGCANNLNLEAAGVTYDKEKGKIPCTNEQTNVPHIYAIGDVVLGMPELTPVAIQAGKLLVKRLYGGSSKQMDYTDICTTVFTPIEYGCVGYAEEDAKKELGPERIKVYHCYNQPLEWKTSPERHEEFGYMKFIVDLAEKEKVVGVHILGPNAGEVIQGLGVAMKAGFTKDHLDDCVGIHPTFAEAYTTMTEVKEEGKDLAKGANC